MNHHKGSNRLLLIIVLLMVLFITVPALAAGSSDTTTSSSIDTNQIYPQTYSDDRSGQKVTFGGNTFSREIVNGDAVAIGGNTKVLNGANGSVVAIGGNAEAMGVVNGDVVAIGGNAQVEGNVNGDVVAIGGKVILKGNTVINGQVVASKIEKDDGVIIKGDIVQTNIPYFKIPMIRDGGAFAFAPFIFWIKLAWLILTFVIISLVIALYPRGVERISYSVEKDTVRGLTIGFIAFITMFPIFITIIGIPVVILLIGAAKYLGFAGVILFVGRKFINTVNLKISSIYLQALIGFILISLIEFIPILGWLIGLILFWLSLGVMIDSKFGTGRPWFNRN